MLNQLNKFSDKTQYHSQSILVADVEIIEVTKLAEKAKWNERFYKSYSGSKIKIAIDALKECRVFVAIYKGNELGYIRIHSVNNTFAKFYDGDVWAVSEGYVKPPYRSNGILTLLRRFVVDSHNVKVLRIETERYNKIRRYYSEQGFVLAYDVGDSDISIICLPEFYDAMWAYNNYNSKH